MTTTGFEPARFKATQRANWNAMSGGWLSWQDKFERGATPVSEHLIALAGLRQGHRVLDVGTGVGEPALTAARVVGPTGHVTAIDLAEDMVAIATERAARLDDTAAPVEVRQGDVETLDLPAGSYDAVLSRWGLMFAVDHIAAFRAVAAVLRPGGTLAASVWGEPAEAPMVSRGFRVLAQRLDLPKPPPGEPNPYSMADREQTELELRAAGFTDVEVTDFTAPFWLADADEYVEFYRKCSPPALLGMIEQRYGSADDPGTWTAIAESIADLRATDGTIRLPSRTRVIRARR
ncbi:class I SAM-dependent methyltransferase [Actinokineospora cianjurensis]|uniref:Ubiquinone/menaquinone biosynthesis C-methylase UbiE n=1 Tax=Actinokineospora cianjurensis TaxID=585224 RepID=A0A421B144_9PSEU|nr:class I SAM-dependent methyltransferase [Actinokineospora cianjurensis]RLK58087.1 ubiquinone/menaquinone biosynthesis C-methylase UbiE [Actinokineospora cianjurensis]